MLIAGLTGGAHDNYIKQAGYQAVQMGMKCVVLNCRGMSNTPLGSVRLFNSKFNGDLRVVTQYIKNKFQGSTLYAAGWSLGANILVNYLGMEGEKSQIDFAVSLGNPFDLDKCRMHVNSTSNRIYQRSYGSSMRKAFRRHEPFFLKYKGPIDIDLGIAMKGKCAEDFDESITRRVEGYRSLEEYYQKCSCYQQLKNVKVPLMCIQAQNDPIVPQDVIPYKECLQNQQHIILVTTPTGGHLGWVSGRGASLGKSWAQQAMFEYFNVVQEVTEEEQDPNFQRIGDKNLNFYRLGDVEVYYDCIQHEQNYDELQMVL